MTRNNTNEVSKPNTSFEAQALETNKHFCLAI